MSEGFDDIIRKKLQAYKSEQGFAWEDFKSKLDSELTKANSEADASNIDILVKQKLKDYSVPFEASHWAILRDKLRQQVKNLENLYISKAFEVLTIFLLLFYFGQFVLVTSSSNTPKAQLVQKTETTIPLNSPSNNIQETVVANLSEKTNKSSDDISSQTKNINSPFVNTKSTTSENPPNDVVTIIDTDNNSSNNEAGIGVLDHQLPDLFRIRKFNQISGHCEMPKAETIEALAIVSIPVDKRKLNLIEVLRPVEKTNSDKLSMFINLDNTLVNTPPDQVYANIGMVLFNSFDYGGGINYQKALNKRFEAGLGLGYSTISYTPQKVEEVFIDEESGGTYSVHLNNINFNVINVPTFVNYHFVKKDNWSLYATAGIISNIIAKAEYGTEFLTLRPTNIPPSFQDVNTDGSGSESGPRLFEKTFNNGLFEGGSLADNLYFSANFGLGLTKNIKDDVSMFTSVNYRNHILDDGIGPNNDKLSAVSFQLGLQYDLN